MGKLFGTDGVRGIANKDLTNELAMQIGMAAAEILIEECEGTPTVMIGKDTRASGDMLEAALTAGFCSVGVNVLSVGVVPTPAVAYLVGKYGCAAGVMISASHNPCEYNGIKIFQSTGYKLPDETEEKIEAIILDKNYEIKTKIGGEVGKRIYCKTAVEDYINHVVSVAEVRFDGLNIAIDTANGSASVCAKEIFTRLGAKCHMLSDTPNGVNINLNCGSTHPEELMAFVKANKLDLGVAFDGDADRMLAVDEKGHLVDGDQVMAICGNYMKQKGRLKKNTIVVTIMSNLGFTLMGEKEGIHVEKTKVGDRYVLENMREHGYNIGGEQSGHVIFLDDNTTGDGLLSALHLLEVMVDTGKPLSELAAIMEVLPQALVNAKVPNHKKEHFMEYPEIADAITELEKKFNGEGRVLIRPSGTEPLVRVMIEGKDQKVIDEEAKRLAELITRIML